MSKPHGPMPDGLELARSTPQLDQETVPAGLLKAHRIASGVWGRLVVHSGELVFRFEDELITRHHITAGEHFDIPPDRPHHLIANNPVSFVVEFYKAPDNSVGNPSVLFLCVHNAGRSQMAAGWMRHLGGDRVDVFSGGSEPADSVNQAAVEAMDEKGIDITAAVPQLWTDEAVKAADVVVTMGCGDTCPVYPGIRYVDWELQDPAGMGVESVRPIRDDIEQRVRGLLQELDVTVE